MPSASAAALRRGARVAQRDFIPDRRDADEPALGEDDFRPL